MKGVLSTYSLSKPGQCEVGSISDGGTRTMHRQGYDDEDDDDGNEVSTPIASGPGTGALANTAAFRIGAHDEAGTPNSFFNGVIDEVSVYPRQLTPTEVADHYAALVPGGADPASGGGGNSRLSIGLGMGL